ncbi:O-antigen polymerase [Celerinatantimonas diazotrophica]|uniref:Oligosaccharide repeat unit polymerase n=1 Tax=Celerinatantimonas diazotrophica TaxID=412034 RepID=A0A4R1K4K6_9GAMM|nr:O-antigen polymerase [Celerinatantimonas diazotrophica]TCK59076.1 oligosaccharide repeat unit polymerase [Celerinatantimonas diazotrophica]CAG9297713.1 hypothetical protein CEDIAZO_02902 [Celerinatantimonas diazotrophica]
MKYIYFTINTTSLLSLNFIVWGSVSILYAFHLSDLLGKVNGEDVYFAGLLIPLTFFIGYLSSLLMLNKTKKIKLRKNIVINIDKLQRKTKMLSFVFFISLILEIAYSGYIPLLSMVRGANLSQFTFGIHGLHGMLMSFGALLSLTWFLIFYVTKHKSALVWVFFIFLLFALVVTRKMIIVSFLQIVILMFFLRRNNKIVLKFIIYGFLLLLVFGFIGDIRTGRELFLSLSHFNVPYPNWLPTGFGWVYIYVTTPIANFINGISMIHTCSYDLSFLKGLLPSFIRMFFFKIDSNKFDNDWQISGAFNVATGFLGIYKSFGISGVIVFNFLLGWIYNMIICSAKNLNNLITVVVFSNITILLLFTNNFFNLNTVSQIVFAYMLFGFKYRFSNAQKYFQASEFSGVSKVFDKS